MRKPQADEAHGEDDQHGLRKRAHELLDGAAHHGRLVGDLVDFHPHRQIVLEPGHLALERLAQGEDVAALAHGDRQPDGLAPVMAQLQLRGIDVAAIDLGDVAEAKQPAVGLDADLAHAVERSEGAAHAHEDAIVLGFVVARGHQVVLLAQDVEDRQRVDAQRGQLAVRGLDVDLLFLVADHVDLGHVGHAQQLVAHAVDVVAQLRERIAVGGEGVDRAERVAELVVQERALHAGRQGVADVGDLLVHLVPGVGDLLGRRVVLQKHEDQRLPGLGVAARVVEPRRLLQLLLEALGNLLLDLARSRARPQGAHHHDLEGEVRVFRLAQAHVGVDAGDGQRDDQIQDEGLMLEGPLG